MSILNRRDLIAGAAAVSAVSALPCIRKALADAQFQVSFIYVGPVGDYGWSYQHDQGRKALQEKLGDKITTKFVESVAEGPDTDRVLRQLASSGSQMIYSTSFGFMNSALRVAKQFPAVKFEQATGYKTAVNLAEYNGRFYEARTVCGTLAGHLSKSAVIGYIGSFPIPEVVMGINAFTIAARRVNPAIKVKIIWINAWFDPGKESDAAKSLIDQGADILCTHTDSPAVIQTAESRKVMSFGQDSDMSKFGPTMQLTALVDDWSGYYISRTQAALDGSWTVGSTWGGLKSGLVKLAPYGPAVTAPARSAADATQSAIIAGTLIPFAGPIKDNKGEGRVAAGSQIDDGDLQKMDWYVEGVQV